MSTDDIRKNGNFEDANPNDGWRVKEFEYEPEGSISLWIEYIVDGVSQEEYSLELAKWPENSLRNSGERERLRPLATAMARFANLGGDFQQLFDVATMIEDIGLRMDWDAQGWYVFDTKQEPGHAEKPTHYFVNDGGLALVWVEDHEIKLTTLAALIEGDTTSNENESLHDREDSGSEDQDNGGPCCISLSE